MKLDAAFPGMSNNNPLDLPGWAVIKDGKVYACFGKEKTAKGWARDLGGDASAVEYIPAAQSREKEGRFELCAKDLLIKTGFRDGELLDHLLEANGLPWAVEVQYRGEECWLSHAVLQECVERYLLPALQGVELDFNMSRDHNPVRARFVDGVGDVFAQRALAGVRVRLEVDQVVTVGREIAAATSAEMDAEYEMGE